MDNFTAGLSIKKQELVRLMAEERQGGTQPQLRARKWDRSRPLSFAQERLWFLDQWQPDNINYNIGALLRITGPLLSGLLQQAFKEIVRRHEALRASFVVRDGKCDQVLIPGERFEIAIEDVSACSSPAAEAHGRATELFRTPFNLANGPLLRTRLYRSSPDEHYLALTFHHILTDAWSFGILFRELGEIYGRLVEQHSPGLEELPIQYADFAYWQRQFLETDSISGQVEYWRKQLSGPLPLLDLPTDRPRPAMPTLAGTQLVHVISKDLSDRLRAFSREQNVTLFMLLLAGFKATLCRFTGQADIIVGTPVAGRTHVKTEQLIGFFVNTLALRTSVPYEITFTELLSRVKETCLRALANQDVPFEKLVKELHPDRNVSRSPIFQVLFSLQNAPAQTLALANLKVEIERLGNPSSKFEITFDLFDRPEGLSCLVEYNTDLFDAATIRRITGAFELLLAGAVANPSGHVWRLPLLSDQEQWQMLDKWNRTKREYPRLLIHDLISKQARKRPHQQAVRFGDRVLTYSELETRSNQLGHALRRRGVRQESIVGVLLERSERMPVALLGVLKAGGAYVPLDPAYPADRIRYVLEDAGCRVVVTEAGLQGMLEDLSLTRLCLDETWAQISQEQGTHVDETTDARQLAYVIYTSGSTGKPKGVMIEHEAVVNLLASMEREPGMTEQDRLLAVTTLSFDIAGLEMYLPLVVGGTIEVATHAEVIDAGQLQRKLTESRATVMQATPATWRMLVDSGWKGDSKLKVLCGGEALARKLADDLVERAKEVWNVYGPTETTIWSSLGRVGKDNPVRIGRPLANTTMYVVDRRTLQPQPVGVTGELLIGGSGVARGYWGRHELTAEKFIASPFRPGERLYRTGDLARWTRDGELECLGRLDQQIKIRGYRVELGEIEAILGQNPGVQQAVVTAREDRPGDERLVAYVVNKPGSILAPVELRADAQRKLPQYMVPASFVFLESLPLTPNGKVDRQALPAPEAARPDGETGYVPPRNEVEHAIAKIWQVALRIDQVGRDDNFFDLGGHSLLIVEVHSALRAAFATSLSLIDLFRYPTIKSLAECLRDPVKEQAPWQRAEDRAAMRHAAMSRRQEVRIQR